MYRFNVAKPNDGCLAFGRFRTLVAGKSVVSGLRVTMYDARAELVIL